MEESSLLGARGPESRLCRQDEGLEFLGNQDDGVSGERHLRDRSGLGLQ